MDQITSTANMEDEALPSVLNSFLNYLGRGGNLQYFVDFRDTGQQYKFFKVGETIEIPQWKTVYFSVNPVYKKPENGKATIQDVMAINTLFADMDGKDFSGGHYNSKEWSLQPEDIRDAANVKALAHIESFTPPPSIIVFSGGGYQPYWLLKEPEILTDENRGRLANLEARWVDHVGGDKGAKDLCRVLRVPGSYNNKYDPPKQTQFIKYDLSITYTVDELERYLPEQVIKTNGNNNKTYQTSTLDTMFTIVNAMRYLSSERVDNYHNWIEVGQILKQEIGEAGFPIWKTWSETSNNYHNGDCESKWVGFGQRDHPRGELKLGTLIYYAEEDAKNGKAPVGAGALPNVDIVDATSGSIVREYNTSHDGSSWADLDKILGPIEWDWKNWIAKGFLSMLVGKLGVGKSVLELRICACYLLGWEFPDGTPFTGETGKVVWLEGEAGQAMNLSRAKAWGLPIEKIISPLNDPMMGFMLANDAHKKALEKSIYQPDTKFIVIDSLSGVDPRAEKSVEDSNNVKWLADLCKDSGKPIQLSHHIRKRGIFDVEDIITLDRIRGISSILQYCRTIWAIDIPNQLDKDNKRISSLKNNLGKLPEPLGLYIDDIGVIHFGDAPYIKHNETVTEKAIDLLKSLLTKGPVPSKKVEQEFIDAGISFATMNRAKEKLGVVSVREKEGWKWSLPVYSNIPYWEDSK
jgi:hypothetical protein